MPGPYRAAARERVSVSTLQRFHIPPYVGRGAPTPPRPSANGHPPGSHPRRGQDPSLQTDPQTSAHVTPRAGHARPLPHGGSGTAAREQLPVSTLQCFHIPIRRAGCPTPPRPPAATHSRATRRGRRPRRPAKPCAAVLPWVTTRGDSRCRQHPRRGQDPSLRTEPLTGAHANPRAGHARPLPGDNPAHLYTT